MSHEGRPGAGINFAFVHGGMQGGWVWQETLAALATQTSGNFGTALVLDIPGCGTKRGQDTGGIGPAEIATELIAEIEAAGLDDVVLVGHSQAGTILPLIVGRRPQLFRRVIYLTAIAPAAGNSAAASTSDLPPSAAVAAFDPDDPRGSYARMFCNDMSPAETDAFLAKLGADAWPQRTYEVTDWRYDNLDAVPASYVVCLRDGLLDVGWQETFAERVHAQRLVRIDAGHQVMNTRPHALAEALLREGSRPD